MRRCALAFLAAASLLSSHAAIAGVSIATIDPAALERADNVPYEYASLPKQYGLAAGYQVPTVWVAGGGSGFVFPNPTGFEDLCDSRCNNNEAISRTTTYGITENTGNGYPTFLRYGINNAVLRSGSGAYGLGATTSRNGDLRMGSTSIAVTGNAAQAQTGDSADANFNALSAGGTATTTATPLTDAANLVFQMYGINDPGFTGGTGTSPCGLGPGTGCFSSDPKNSFAVISDMITQWRAASKIVFLADETPSGRQTLQLESHACAACTSITATNTTAFVDGLDFSYPSPPLIDQNGDPWTRVANVGACASVAKTYWVSSVGVYTFCTGITVPTNVYLTYAASSATFNTDGPTSYFYLLHSWLASNAATYAPGGISTYSGPGALFNINGVVSVPIWEALVNPADTTNNNALDGALWDGRHPSILGQVLAAAAERTAFLSVYPALTASQANAPAANNWNVCQTNGGATFSNAACGASTPGVLPASMLTNCASPISVKNDGVVLATGAGGVWTSAGATVTAGSYNCSTGAWTITFSAAPTTSKKFEIDEDAGNWLFNGLMEAQGVAGTQVSNATGAVPTSWVNTATGGITTCLTGVTCAIAQSATTCQDPDGSSWPCQKVVITGVIGSGGGNLSFINSISGGVNKVPAGVFFRGGATIGIAPGPNGYVYGLQTGGSTASMTVSVAYTPGYQGASASTTSIRGVNGSGTSTTLVDSSGVAAWIAKFPANMSNGGTALVYQTLSPAVDTTGLTPANITAASLSLIVALPAGPISATLYLSRAHMRSFTQ